MIERAAQNKRGATIKGDCYPTDNAYPGMFGVIEENYAKGSVIFDCTRLIGPICRLTKAPCPVLESMRSRGKETTPDMDILTCNTPAGTIIFDSKLDEVLLSDLLPAEHDPVELSPALGALLEKLMREQGEIVNKKDLLATYKEGDLTGISTETIPTQIFFLRRAIGQTTNKRGKNAPQIIKTHRDGYYIPKK